MIHNKLNNYKKPNLLDILEEEKSVETTEFIKSPTLGNSEIKSPTINDHKSSFKSGTSES
jgi:hypothetical protein